VDYLHLRIISVVVKIIVLSVYIVTAVIVLCRVRCSLDTPAYVTMAAFFLCGTINLVFYLLELLILSVDKFYFQTPYVVC
jgi:hypothetical protein